MELKIGQEVKLNNGEVHEVRRENINGHFDIDGWWYTSEGIFLGEGKFYRLSVKRIIEEPDSKSERPDLSNPDKVPFEDMTDEQQAFLLLADHRGDGVKLLFNDEWIDCKNPSFIDGAAYRLKSASPSWLPLEVGKVYVDENGIERRCVSVEGGVAWLVRKEINDTAAYVWNANTGEAKHLSSNITGPAENTEGEN